MRTGPLTEEQRAPETEPYRVFLEAPFHGEESMRKPSRYLSVVRERVVRPVLGHERRYESRCAEI